MVRARPVAPIGGRADARTLRLPRGARCGRCPTETRRTATARSAGSGAAAKAKAPIELVLLGTFDVRVGSDSIGPLSAGSARLLVLLALRNRPVARPMIAATLWPESSHQRAGDSLRAALSRLGAKAKPAVVESPAGLRLADEVTVDLHRCEALARRVLQAGPQLSEGDLSPAAISLLSAELLPDWCDEWVVGCAEDWRQLRLSALETQARILTASGQLSWAVAAARAAMSVDPRRESAHASLIRVHLAEGNQSEALRVFEQYRARLMNELGLQPTSRLCGLVADLQRGAVKPSLQRGA